MSDITFFQFNPETSFGYFEIQHYQQSYGDLVTHANDRAVHISPSRTQVSDSSNTACDFS